MPTIDGNIVALQGRVELVVAQGKQKPRKPFFFLNAVPDGRQEYKPQIKGTNDPKGQLLIAMLVAQAKNENHFPMLGAYLIGKFWQFVVLQNSEYAVSKSFDATEDDIWQIFRILKQAKVYIEQFIEKEKLAK